MLMFYKKWYTQNDMTSYVLGVQITQKNKILKSAQRIAKKYSQFHNFNFDELIRINRNLFKFLCDG